jgi:hypothetical protein
MVTRPSPSSAPLRSVITCAAVIGMLALTACSPDQVTTDPSSSAAPEVSESGAATPAPSRSPSKPPELHPDGTATDNLPLFSEVTKSVWASEQKGTARAYVDALVAAGFEKERMQVTNDVTTVGNPVESLQFSVAWGKSECLIGQVGPSTGDPVTTVMAQLAEGRCLVGTTRAIDW